MFPTAPCEGLEKLLNKSVIAEVSLCPVDTLREHVTKLQSSSDLSKDEIGYWNYHFHRNYLNPLPGNFIPFPFPDEGSYELSQKQSSKIFSNQTVMKESMVHLWGPEDR